MRSWEANGVRRMVAADDGKCGSWEAWEADGWMELGSGGMGMGGYGNVCRRWSVAERVDDGAGAGGGRRREEDQRAGRGRGAEEGGGWAGGVPVGPGGKGGRGADYGSTNARESAGVLQSA